MGFTKWFFKNGPGSIGSVVKHWTKLYIKTKQDHGGEMDEDEIFTSLFMSFRFGLRAAGKRTVDSDVEEVVALCSGNLDRLLIYMILENAEYVKVLYNSDKALITMLEVIIELLQEYNIQNISAWDSFELQGLKVAVGYRYVNLLT